jgi:hypothetical protein
METQAINSFPLLQRIIPPAKDEYIIHNVVISFSKY